MQFISPNRTRKGDGKRLLGLCTRDVAAQSNVVRMFRKDFEIGTRSQKPGLPSPLCRCIVLQLLPPIALCTVYQHTCQRHTCMCVVWPSDFDFTCRTGSLASPIWHKSPRKFSLDYQEASFMATSSYTINCTPLEHSSIKHNTYIHNQT